MSRVVIEVCNADDRIVAQSAVGDDVTQWVCQTSTIIRTGNYLRARVLRDDESAMEVEH